MTIIDADKFLAYLIYSKHIDGLTCGEVKEAVEMCKVDVLDKIREAVESIDTRYYSSVYGMDMTECADDIKYGILEIIDKYMTESEDKE